MSFLVIFIIGLGLISYQTKINITSLYLEEFGITKYSVSDKFWSVCQAFTDPSKRYFDSPTGCSTIDLICLKEVPFVDMCGCGCMDKN